MTRQSEKSQASTLLICSLTTPDATAMRQSADQASDRGADAIEYRLDLLAAEPDEAQLALLLVDPPLPVIVTCRPVRQGGQFDGDESARLALLARAARFKPAYIDVEYDVPPQAWPKAPIILSYHDFDGAAENLDSIAADMERSPAAVNKIVLTATGPEDALRAFDTLRSCRKPTIALAMGESGVISRILAGKFGAFGTFASLSAGRESAPGQPSLQQFKDMFRWDSISSDTAVYGVIGCPVAHSMSPAIHNAAFAAAEINAVYVPLLIAGGADNFNRFMDALATRPWMDLRGLSVTIPHKENALAYVGADHCDQLACKIGAINTVTIPPSGPPRGDNTDYAAAVDALCNAMGISRRNLAGRRTAVLGAGGVARAIVAALTHYHADVTVYNRTINRAEALSREFACKSAGLGALESINAEIIINCTPLGMHPNVDAAAISYIPPGTKVVFDTIYNPVETQLLAMARAAGCQTISGLDMFVRQAALQFETWTAAAAPLETMRRVATPNRQT